MEKLQILYEALCAATRDGWCVVDGAGAVIHCNPAFGTITGLDIRAAVGVDFPQLLSAHRLAVVDEATGADVTALPAATLADLGDLAIVETGNGQEYHVDVFRLPTGAEVLFAFFISIGARVLPGPAAIPEAVQPRTIPSRHVLAALDLLDVGVLICGRDGRIRYGNAAAVSMGLVDSDERPSILHDGDGEPLLPRVLASVLVEGERVSLSHGAYLSLAVGGDRTVEVTAAPVVHEERPSAAVVVVRDVTIERRTEDELRRAQHMESVASLAGGIAHDFNNVLTAVLGNITLAKVGCKGRDEQLHALQDAEEAASEAKGLTQQLLVFSHGGVPVRKSASIGEIVSDSAGFVVRGSNVKCCMSSVEAPWPVRVDRDQISQVVQNLVLNAKEAMPEGGIVSISLQNRHLSQQLDEIPAGRYVTISVQDEGFGIPRKNLSRVIEPYFTTKPSGSGLGLAVAYSIVKNHDGYLQLSSEAGEGTTAVVYLPVVEQSGESKRSPESIRLHLGIRVLVMDDEALIRTVLTKMLRRLGCRSSAAENGNEAVYLYQRAFDSGHPFDLVILDLTVPGGMGGKEALIRIRDINPDACVVVSSGYSNDPVMADHERHGFQGVISKPYSLAELSEVLDRLFP